MNLSHSINQNSLYIILLLITGVIIPLEYISNGTYYLVTIFIMVPFGLKILMDIKWGIPLIIITTLYPNEGRLLNMPLLNLTNIIFLLMLISYMFNPKQLDFSKLKKYNMIKRFIFIFIILDFISTIRMSGYYFEEGIISVFQYYFFKSNLYPVLFLIILTFRNATHRYYNNNILTFVSIISILNLIFIIKYFLISGNFVGFANYVGLQLFLNKKFIGTNFLILYNYC